MLFNSIHFLIFLPIVVVIYFLMKQKYRWIVLLIASYYFYMSWSPKYAVLIMISTLVDYLAALRIDKTESKSRKKLLLFGSLFTNLGLLFTFKYFNFFNQALSGTLKIFSLSFDPLILKVLLPVGISFYTFQTLSYTIDVYRGAIKPEKHLGIFAVYVSFFPQLVAGPIERASNLIPQFHKENKFEYSRVSNGIKIVIWGFFKKVVIADRLALVVNTVYNDPTSYTGIPLIVATIFFAFQIYCDFSGYSDIAIGTAQIMGYKLMCNFRRPYYSKSISEFWNRWHISLSTWFRDYVYTPLVRKRISMGWLYLSLFITFMVSGIWHGANYTFIIWGSLHGLFLVTSLVTQRIRNRIAKITRIEKFPKIHSAIRIIFIFTLVNLGWIFFRANSLKDAIYILTHIFKGLSRNIFKIPPIGIGPEGLIILFFSILIMEFVHIIQEKKGMRKFLSEIPVIVKIVFYTIIVLIILLFGVFNKTQFIYFQF